jgi:hypothetical protein
VNFINDTIFLNKNAEQEEMHDWIDSSNWMKAVRKPTSYRVGNTRFSLKPQFQLLIMIFCTLFIIIYLLLIFSDGSSSNVSSSTSNLNIANNLQSSK